MLLLLQSDSIWSNRQHTLVAVCSSNAGYRDHASHAPERRRTDHPHAARRSRRTVASLQRSLLNYGWFFLFLQASQKLQIGNVLPWHTIAINENAEAAHITPSDRFGASPPLSAARDLHDCLGSLAAPGGGSQNCSSVINHGEGKTCAFDPLDFYCYSVGNTEASSVTHLNAQSADGSKGRNTMMTYAL